MGQLDRAREIDYRRRNAHGLIDRNGGHAHRDRHRLTLLEQDRFRGWRQSDVADDRSRNAVDVDRHGVDKVRTLQRGRITHEGRRRRIDLERLDHVAHRGLTQRHGVDADLLVQRLLSDRHLNAQ